MSALRSASGLGLPVVDKGADGQELRELADATDVVGVEV